MGLVKDGPAPDADAPAPDSEQSEASELMAEADEPVVPKHHAPTDMFAWHPHDSAADLLPGAADAPAEPSAGVEGQAAPEAASDDNGLSSWLGTSSVLSKATAPAPAPATSDAISLWHPMTAMLTTDPGNTDSEPAEPPSAAPAPKAAALPVARAPRLA